MHGRRTILDVVNGEFVKKQMERVLVTGLWCAHRDPSHRPSIYHAGSWRHSGANVEAYACAAGVA
jgi:hypothetical protein